MRPSYNSLEDYFTIDQSTHIYSSIQYNNIIKMILITPKVQNRIPEKYIHQVDKIFKKEFSLLQIII